MQESIIRRDSNAIVSDANETLEKQALNKVVRDSWRNKLDAKHDAKIADSLNSHAANMRKVLGTFDYEVLCMPNIIANSKQMTRSELSQYLSMIEALAIGYKHMFENDFVSILMAGLTLKARNISSMSRYFDMFVKDIENKSSSYRKKAEKVGGSVEKLAVEIERMERSLIRRFFKKGEIRLLRAHLSSRSKRIYRFTEKERYYSNISSRVRGIAGLKL
jgi:hypothetical protein